MGEAVTSTELTRIQRLNLAGARLVGAPLWHSISGYTWRLESQGKPWGKFFRPRIDAWFKQPRIGPWLLDRPAPQVDHCRKAYEREIKIYEGRA
jgi:hypothetical protein